MKNFKFFKKCNKISALLAVMMVGFVYFSSFTAFAAVDLDITIIPPEDSVTNKSTFTVQLQIDTKSTNGYVELQVDIEYDADILALSSPVNTNGYRITGSNGQLTLVYYDPTGTNTPTEIGNQEILDIEFIVMEDAPSTETTISATVDHAYNSSGKNVTWTAIYDKTVEVIKLSEAVDSDDETDEETEETSSTFVVGEAGVVSLSTSITGSSGKVAAVVAGALVVFAAGIVIGYIICMKKYENKTPDYDDYDDYYEDTYIGKRSPESIPDEEKPVFSDPLHDEDNDDGRYYDEVDDGYNIPDEDDYFTSPPAGESGGNLFSAFRMPDPAPRPMSPLNLDNMSELSDSSSGSGADDDDYPALFRNMSSSSGQSPSFDEKTDTVFGKYSDNVDRNTDDGYGAGFSAPGRNNPSERSRRNR